MRFFKILKSENNYLNIKNSQYFNDDIDELYFDAIYNNKKNARNIVDKYAKIKMPKTKAVNSDGTLMYLYHQTANKFDVFDLDYTDTKGSGGRLEYKIPYAIYTKLSPDPIALSGDQYQYQLKLFLNIKNPIEVYDREELSEFLRKNINEFEELEEKINREREENLKQIGLSDDPESAAKNWTNQYEKLAINVKKIVDDYFRNDTSYDGIIMEDDHGQTSYIVFYNNQIKLANIITKNGDKIIPLSDRFDFSKSDIRY